MRKVRNNGAFCTAAAAGALAGTKGDALKPLHSLSLSPSLTQYLCTKNPPDIFNAAESAGIAPTVEMYNAGA